MVMRLNLETLALSVAAVALGVGALTASVPGCTVLTNDALPDDAGPFEAGPDAGTQGSAACGGCVAQECIGTWAVCLTDESCLKLRGCSNDQCLCAGIARGDAGVDPLAAYMAFASCSDALTCASSCAASCSATCKAGAPQTTPKCTSTSDAGSDGATDAGDAAVPEGPSAVRCAACVSDKCDAAKKLCAIGSECAAFLACAKGCTDAPCVDACGKSHSTGKASATELSSCTLTSCRAACGL